MGTKVAPTRPLTLDEVAMAVVQWRARDQEARAEMARLREHCDRLMGPRAVWSAEAERLMVVCEDAQASCREWTEYFEQSLTRMGGSVC